MCAGTSLCLATKMDDKELFVVGAEFSELKFNGVRYYQFNLKLVFLFIEKNFQ